MQLPRRQIDIQMDVETVDIHKSDKAHKRRLKMHQLPITCLCIDSKSTHAFTASKDGSIVKWCLESRKMLIKVDSIKQNEAHSDKDSHQSHHVKHINAIAISHDDKFLATGGWDMHIRIWSPVDMQWLHTFTMHRQEITSLAFRQCHPTLYSGSNDRSVMIWSLEDDDNRCFVEALYGHESPITSMDSLKKERILTSGGLDQSIRLWKIVEQAQTVFQSSHKSVDVARLIDDKTFISGGEDGSITVWTTMKRSPLLVHHNAHGIDQEVPKRENEADPFSSKLSYWISSLAVSQIQKKVQNGKQRKRRKLDVDLETATYEHDASESDGNNDKDEQATDVEGGAVAMVASGSCDSKLKLWNLMKKEGQYELKLIESYDCPGFINDIKFTRDGSKILAACGQEHRLGRWWKMSKTKNCLRIFDVNNKC